MALASMAPATAPMVWAAMYGATWTPLMPVFDRRPSSQSAAVTTGLKCAPDTGPNIRINTANPNTVAVLFSNTATRCRPARAAGRRSRIRRRP
jgi:hypothetical protein